MRLIPFFEPANVSGVLEAVSSYENSVIHLPADDDAEW
jgi:hypothetical protein